MSEKVVRIPGKSTVVRDDNIGHVYSSSNVTQLIQHNIRIRNIKTTANSKSQKTSTQIQSGHAKQGQQNFGSTRTVTQSKQRYEYSSKKGIRSQDSQSNQLCECDDKIKALCLSEDKRLICKCAECEVEGSNNEDGNFRSKEQLSSTSSFNNTTASVVGSKIYAHGERSKRWNKEPEKVPSVDLTKIPRDKLPILGRASLLVDHRSVSEEELPVKKDRNMKPQMVKPPETIGHIQNGPNVRDLFPNTNFIPRQNINEEEEIATASENRNTAEESWPWWIKVALILLLIFLARLISLYIFEKMCKTCMENAHAPYGKYDGKAA